MKKTYLIALLLGIVFAVSMNGDATEATRLIDPVDTLIIMTGGELSPHDTTDSTIIYYPGLNAKARFAGFVSLGVLLSSSDATDSLDIWVKPLIEIPSGRITETEVVSKFGQEFMVDETDSIILATDLDWVSGDFYNFPITTPFGASKGMIVYFRYTAVAGQEDTIQIAPFATVQ